MLVKELSLLFSENIHDSEYDHIHPALGGVVMLEDQRAMEATR